MSYSILQIKVYQDPGKREVIADSIITKNSEDYCFHVSVYVNDNFFPIFFFWGGVGKCA